MTEHALSAIGAGIFIAILDILIKYVGVMDLIVGYDPEKVADEVGLANVIGTNALYVAVLTVSVSVLELRLSTVDSEWDWIVFLVAVSTWPEVGSSGFSPAKYNRRSSGRERKPRYGDE